ncbi:hypothetical protein JAAARDRAFT_200893 [Jaapia argillacea MUCL 33604]|uniref:Uncharacterized protein n=1 Tax=Jaapia argillacea MUCL 33604 TaxID=933084 RepID=A0A067PEI5_9AGAM|nr:hypothetical protein JAAARDRAFT_200893 [Jaapia argillacea MUCL 33604]
MSSQSTQLLSGPAQHSSEQPQYIDHRRDLCQHLTHLSSGTEGQALPYDDWTLDLYIQGEVEHILLGLARRICEIVWAYCSSHDANAQLSPSDFSDWCTGVQFELLAYQRIYLDALGSGISQKVTGFFYEVLFAFFFQEQPPSNDWSTVLTDLSQDPYMIEAAASPGELPLSHWWTYEDVGAGLTELHSQFGLEVPHTLAVVQALENACFNQSAIAQLESSITNLDEIVRESHAYVHPHDPPERTLSSQPSELFGLASKYVPELAYPRFADSPLAYEDKLAVLALVLAAYEDYQPYAGQGGHAGSSASS